MMLDLSANQTRPCTSAPTGGGSWGYCVHFPARKLQRTTVPAPTHQSEPSGASRKLHNRPFTGQETGSEARTNWRPSQRLNQSRPRAESNSTAATSPLRVAVHLWVFFRPTSPGTLLKCNLLALLRLPGDLRRVSVAFHTHTLRRRVCFVKCIIPDHSQLPKD